MNLVHLAPDIQERVLLLPPVDRGKDRLTERNLRAVVAAMDWKAQRRVWTRLAANYE